MTAIDENCNGSVAFSEGCTCGDGMVTQTEQCDDGNTSNADDCSSVCKVQRVVEIAAGAAHVCALLSDGRAKCWGRDGLGELGNPNGNQWLGDAWDFAGKNVEMGANLPAIDFSGRLIKSIVAAGGSTCALFVDGGVKCWGHNWFCKLGQAESDNNCYDWTGSPSYLPDIALGGPTASISGSYAHFCALLANGTVKCWGRNEESQLGLADGDSSPHPIPTTALNFGGHAATQISVGGSHSCALFTSGAVRCWGGNNWGQLGRGSTENYGLATNHMGTDLKPIPLGQPAIAVSAGSYHTCALLANGKMKCWGYNAFGQLGLGHAYNIGDQPNEMETLQPVTLVLPAGLTISGIHAAGHQTCAIISDGSLRCWGDNQFDQDLTAEEQVVSNTHIGDHYSEMGAALAPIDLGPNAHVQQVAQNEYVTCALLATGNVKCWGTASCNFGGDLTNGQCHGDIPSEMGAGLRTVRLFSSEW